MLDRRTFLTAAVGAATFPMPALARAEPKLVRLAGYSPDTTAGGNAFNPSLTRFGRDRLLASWTRGGEPGVRGYTTHLQRFSADFRSPAPVRVLRSTAFLPAGLCVGPEGGIAVTSDPVFAVHPLDGSGVWSGKRVVIGRDPERQAYFPVIAPLASGGFLVAATTALGVTTIRRRGIQIVEVAPDGLRRSAFLWLTRQSAESMGDVCAVVTTTGGATVVATMRIDGERWLVMRRRAADGFRAAKVIDRTPIDQAADKICAFSPVATDQIAGVWARNGEWVGGVFDPDGRRLVAFEPMPFSDPKAGFEIHAGALVPLDEGRVLCLLNGAVYDTIRGSIVSRVAMDAVAGKMIRAVAPLSGDRFALADDRRSPCSFETYGLA